MDQWNSNEFTEEEIQEIRQFTPSSTKNLRACIRCRIILAKDQFYQLGCPTCEETLRMKESDGRVLACTTANFTGIIALLRQGTWVSRFNGLQGRRPGVYALTVQGEIPSRILNESDYEEEDTAIASNIEEEKAAAATPTIKGTVEGSTSATPRLPPKLKAPKEAKPKKTPKEVKPKKPKEVKPKEPKASKQKPSTPAATSPEDSDTDSEGPLLGDAAKYLDDISSLGDSDEEPADKQPEKPSAPEPALEPPAKRLRPAAEDILEPEGDTEFR
ncbi:unnamed protein product [Prorocentrum cordatum]|uniref:Spt4/RpoE2 zinc finger domain-containing protein n=1 Tax=Prorocentrum cordatum TaxID=2364126 RepID=A0ABN9XNR9_9DINO|nr:unnamed protein product [Polarella glacialis]